MAKWEVVCDDVLHWAESYSGPKFHAILTDPPYSLGNGERGFMGKAWDNGIAFRPETWAALSAHLLPGAHLLAFGGSRTHHRLMCATEDAGLEIRDCIYWAFGSGFPKSANVSKHIDRAAKAEREVIGTVRAGFGNRNGKTDAEGGVMLNSLPEELKHIPITAAATPAAATWEGYGTALKPAVEVIVVARKPVEGTIAGNCQRYGSGALNIDGTRIPTNGNDAQAMERCNTPGSGRMHASREFPGAFGRSNPTGPLDTAAGRWPANLILDDSEAVAGLFPVTTSGGKRDGATYANNNSSQTSGKGIYGKYGDTEHFCYGDSASAARFFYQATWELDQAEQLDAADVLRYCAKASRAERDAGLEGMPEIQGLMGSLSYDKPSLTCIECGRTMPSGSIACGRCGGALEYAPQNGTGRTRAKAHNNHPCVKNLSLCRYLATLLLPPAAYAPRRILIPFGGVASEAIGAGLAGWDEIVMVESEREYCDIAEVRLAYWLRQPELALR